MDFKKIDNLVITVLTVVIIAAFFLPWVSVHSAPIAGMTKLLTGKQEVAPIDNIALFEVPIMANGDDSRLIISIVKIFKPSVGDIHIKSWGVWGIPFLAVIMAFALSALKGASWKKWLCLAFGIIGCAIFAVGAFKIKTTDLDKLILQITMGPGLWITLWAYLGIGLACLYDFAMVLKKK